jgi:hypothetical protein
MKQKNNLLFVITSLIILLLAINLVLSIDIRPINQISSRGIGEQYRPANQMQLSDSGNGDYIPIKGSYYSSNTI